MKKVDISPPEPKKEPHYSDRSGCSVCGLYDDPLSESAGEARWHKECESAHPEVIAKVKARAK
jgi:hypothetical protein